MMDTKDDITHYIEKFEAAYTGPGIRTTLADLLYHLQYMPLQAKSLGGYLPGDLLTGEMLYKMYAGKTSNSNQLFDSMPKSSSKKGIRCEGVEAAFGDLNVLLRDYDKIFYLKDKKG